MARGPGAIAGPWPEVPRTASIKLPEWLWGGHPVGLVERAQFRVRASKGGALAMQTEEAYLRRVRPGLVDDAVVLSASGEPGRGMGWLEDLVDDGIERPILESLAGHPSLALPPDGTLPGFVDFARRSLSFAAGEALPRSCQDVLDGLQAIRFSEDGSQAFRNSSIFALRRTESLVMRAKLASVLIRLEHDPQLAAGDISEVMRSHAAGENIFASSQELSQGIYVFDAYVAPLLAALSPGVWAFGVHRTHGTLIVSYGRPISGSTPGPTDLLRALHTVGPGEGIQFQPFTDERAPEVAVSWWSARLDELFGVLSDPASFRAEDGSFVPARSLQALLGGSSPVEWCSGSA